MDPVTVALITAAISGAASMGSAAMAPDPPKSAGGGGAGMKLPSYRGNIPQFGAGGAQQRMNSYVNSLNKGRSSQPSMPHGPSPAMGAPQGGGLDQMLQALYRQMAGGR